MAFGHAVMRGGFNGKENASDIVGTSTYAGDAEDELIKGNNDANMIDGAGGDDVVIGKKANDHLAGGDGEDDLSGGEGDDLLVGAIWVDTDADNTISAGDTITQDEYSDDFNGEATFEENGTDTIWAYDGDDSDPNGVVDFIDLSDAVEVTEDQDADLDIDADDLAIVLNSQFSYDTSTGELTDAGSNVWFNVFSDAGTTVADTVYLEVDGSQFSWDDTGGEWVFA